MKKVLSGIVLIAALLLTAWGGDSRPVYLRKLTVPSNGTPAAGPQTSCYTVADLSAVKVVGVRGLAYKVTGGTSTRWDIFVHRNQSPAAFATPHESPWFIENAPTGTDYAVPNSGEVVVDVTADRGTDTNAALCVTFSPDTPATDSTVAFTAELIVELRP